LIPVYEALKIGYGPYVNGELRALAALRLSANATALADTMLAGTNAATIRRLAAVVNGAKEFRAHGDIATARHIASSVLAWCAAHPELPREARELARGGAWLVIGNADSAAMHYERAMHAGFNLESAGMLGVIAARRGDTLHARSIADSLASDGAPSTRGERAYWRAAVVAELGEHEQAMMLLRESTRAGQSMASWHADEALRSLHGYPPFEQLLTPHG
jgi:hypothetical protein